jgi:hypothetical protein
VSEEEEAQNQYTSKWHAAFICTVEILTIADMSVTALTSQLPIFRLNA